MYRIFASPLCKMENLLIQKKKKDYTTYGTSEDKSNGKRYILGAKQTNHHKKKKTICIT